MGIKKIVFTGGGTGGHVYPNIAIYETIKEKYEEIETLYIGTKKGAENKIIKDSKYPIHFKTVNSKGLPLKMKSIKTLISLFHIFIGMIQSFFLLRKFKPDIVIGSGGYVAAPVLMAAAILKKKIFVHEQNAVPGRMNKFIAQFATRIGVSFSSTSVFFDKNKVSVTGYPLRASILKLKEEAVRGKYGIPKKNKVVFIFGGSGGAKTINTAISEIVPSLLAIPRLSVILATGRGYSGEYKALEDTQNTIDKVNIPSELSSRLILKEYINEINEVYSISDLIVCRAGAGTIKEITTIGVPAIVIPKLNLPGDHQILNAKELEKTGGAAIVYEEVRLAVGKERIFIPPHKLFKQIKKLINDDDELLKMGEKLKEVEKGNSCDLIMEEIEGILTQEKEGSKEQIKSYYLQEADSEKTYELTFDSTTVGNNLFCDIFLDHFQGRHVFKIKSFLKNDKVVLKKIRGEIKVNGEIVKNVIELKKNDEIEIENKKILFKTYFEEVQKVEILEKSLFWKMIGSSVGIGFSRIVGFLRLVVISALFGASKITDIFNIGLMISNLMRRIVAENALENAFLPIFSRVFLRKSRKKSWEAASSIVNFNLILALILTGLGIIFTPFILKTLFPEKLLKMGMLQETITMTRIMFPYLFLVTTSAILATYLKAFNHFGIAEFSASFFSVGIIVFILAFHKTIGFYSLGWGVLLGGFLQLVFLLPFIYGLKKNKSIGFTYKPVLHLTSSVNKKYYRQLAPISIDVIISKISDVVPQMLALSLRGEGQVSFLAFAIHIFRLPFSFISQAINSVILKEFSQNVALFEKNKAKKLFEDGVKINVFLLLPVSILMLILAEPLVSIIFKRGLFDQSDVINTALALKFFSIGLIGWGIHAFSTRIFSARIDVKTSMFLNLFMISFHVVLCLFLVKTELTFAGLALASSISYILFAVLRIFILIKKLKNEEVYISAKEVWLNLSKTFVSGIFMLLVMLLSFNVFSKLQFESDFLKNIFILISLSFVGISVYLLSSLMFKNADVLFFQKKLRGKTNLLPVSMMSPFGFYSEVTQNPQKYCEEYSYKINIFLSNSNWEIQNIGVKLIGLFKTEDKINLLIDILNSNPRNGFIRRNSMISLRKLGIWDSKVKDVTKKMMDDSYYETRVEAINLLKHLVPRDEYSNFEEKLMQILKRGMIEEKIAVLKLIGEKGDKKELKFCQKYLLSNNSILRETILEVFLEFYKRKIIDSEEIKYYLDKVLITSNNLVPSFKIKSIINKIVKEIE